MTKDQMYESRWDVVQELSNKGGQGATFIVKSRESDGRSCVLKKLKNNKSEQARRRMYQEVANLRVVANAGGRVPHVLDDNVHEFENPSVKLSFVMEQIDGQTLEEYVKERGRLNVEEAASIVLDICETVNIGHGQMVLHRDLKPKNIMVTQHEGETRTYILDYGLSFNKCAEADEITKMGEPFRNEFLSLPETNVTGGDRRDLRSDFTAISGIFYFCLTGHHPELLRDGENKAPHERKGKSIREILGENCIVQHLEAFFHTGFATTVASRFQSLNDITRRLLAILDRSVEPPTESPEIVARRYSDLMRARNRDVQLGQFREAFQPVVHQIIMHIHQIRASLDLFSLEAFGNPFRVSQHPDDQMLSEGIESLGVGFAVIVQPRHCQHHVVINYIIGAVGMEGVILQSELLMRSNPSSFGMGGLMTIDNPQAPLNWREVFRYPGDSPPSKDVIIEDLNRTINRIMEKYANGEIS